MCETCNKLDAKIEHYQRLARGITDQQMLDRIKELVADMHAQKDALHPPAQES